MKLAINGGSKTITAKSRECWVPPYDEVKAVINDQIDRGVLSGDWEKTYFKFEQEFADYTGAKYCSAYNEGTTSLWSAYLGIGIQQGDEIIVPSYTWIATISPAVYIGARPVFCEIEKGKLVADPADIRKRITPKTKAIVVVHVYGNVANMDEIMKIADEHNLYVIEDCSHCHGAEWKGRKCGTIGHVGCFSLQGDFINGKALPAGEGGLLVTNHKEIFNRILLYTHINRPLHPKDDLNEECIKYHPENLGVKFRAHPFALSIGRVMLKSLDSRNEMKRKYRTKMNNALKDIPGISIIEEYRDSVAGGFYGGMQLVYDKTAFEDLPIDKFLTALKAEGVDLTYRDYVPLHLLPMYMDGYNLYRTVPCGISGDYKGYKKGDLPVTEDTKDNLFGMPILMQEEEEYSDQVIKAFKKVVENYKELLR